MKRIAMRSDSYREFFKAEYMMGPNCLRLLDEILECYPLQYTAENKALDLGCGTGVTSLFIARETGATVYANDLWIAKENNGRRFADWNMQEQLIPMQEDANEMHFEKEMFDAVISIDAYHYFAGKEGFFADKILPYIKRGGIALIVIPGIKKEYEGRSEELLNTWAGDDSYMFQSTDFWKRIIGSHADMEEVRTWEMSSFDLAWQEWFDTGHEFALNDQSFYEEMIKPFTNFVGIMVRKKQ